MRWTKATTVKLSVVVLYTLASLLVTSLASGALVTALGAPLRGGGVVVLAALFAIYLVLMWRDLYSRSYHYYLRHTYRIVVRNSLVAATVVLAAFAVSSAVDNDPVVPRLGLYLVAGAVSFSLMHLLEFAWIRHLSRLGYFRRNVIIVGAPDPRLPLRLYFQDMGRTRRYVGSVCLQAGEWIWLPSRGGRFPLRPLSAELKRIILAERVAQVLFLLGSGIDRDVIQEMTRYCREFSISYYLVADVSDVPVSHGPAAGGGAVDMLDYVPVVDAFCARRDSLTNISIKRTVDVAVAMASLVCSIPLWLFIAFAIKLEDGGPIFYVSKRVGKDGRAIRFYKFRTMVVGAEQRKGALLCYNERPDGPLFKMKDDPRVTRVGRVLRRLSLDEFPQFLNVLLGSMSLTGPRPHLPEEVARYGASDFLRLECMPGIVGLPQVTGRRSTLGFREWMELDLRYRREWSLGLDARIASRALRIVLSTWVGREGRAY